ncbi:cupin 2 conserved barrel domain-containing [Fusarium albosuccineum]|uniref:Cupin 2 conserved barrel domain-containing n=1 Tax=Fusarium albosuccineum TaxID=1237068 RepID=A0A8H4LD31_9HYPO|nr:cupin 2 conserved barrel domain-containing [Fusarium albosuccineum]
MASKSEISRSRPRESGKLLYDYKLQNAPGKSIVAVELDYPPNGFTPPHRHGGATVVAFVTEGELLSGMNGNPPKVYKAGESFMELPGCHHTVGENQSQDQRAKAIAVFIVDTDVVKQGYEGLTVLDEGW